MQKIILRLTFIGIALVGLSACEDSLVQKSGETSGGKTPGQTGHPGDKKANPGDSYRFPEIVETEFIPPYKFFSDYKCRTWKITWPTYDDNYSADLIPTVLSLNNSELNSFNFLNTTAASNTYNGTISLYHGQRVQSAHVMWSELDYVLDAGKGVMENVTFAPGDVPVETLMDWVQERPDLFENHFPEVGIYNELDYVKDDFIHFKLIDSGLYGGVRILSVTPRIIEVYLAVPNY